MNGFQLLKFLGKGTFGAVYEARREIDGQRYAIKKVDTRKMSTKDRAEAVNEIRVLASIGGDHVITFYEAFVDADVLYIVTEYATHGDLLGLLKNKRRAGQLPEALVWSYFIQMCIGLKTLHDHNILHRDLKAANIFMCSPTYLKLGDLGVAKVLKSDAALAQTQVGTPYYVAPEIWRNKAYNGKCDMWSLGCLLYELCTYKMPFEAESMDGLARKVMKGKYEPIPSLYSSALRTTLSKLLVVEPNFRASVNDILGSEAVQARLGDVNKAIAANAHPPAEGIDIVKTIPVPRKFNDLTKNLPPSRYESNKPLPSARYGGEGGGEGAPPKLPSGRNGADGADGHRVDPSAESDVKRMQRHAGQPGGTVANAVASAQQHGFNKAGQRLPNMPGVPPQGGGHGVAPPQPQPQRQRIVVDDSKGGAPLRDMATPQDHRFLPLLPGQQAPGQQAKQMPPTPSSVAHSQQRANAIARAEGRPVVPTYRQAPPTHSDSRRSNPYGYAPPTPSGEIRMVQHTANGQSRVQVFDRFASRGQAYYNPITHQPSQQRVNANGYTNQQIQPVRSRYPPPNHYQPQQQRSVAEQYTQHLQRRRGY